MFCACMILSIGIGLLLCDIFLSSVERNIVIGVTMFFLCFGTIVFPRPWLLISIGLPAMALFEFFEGITMLLGHHDELPRHQITPVAEMKSRRKAALVMAGSTVLFCIGLWFLSMATGS